MALAVTFRTDHCTVPPELRAETERKVQHLQRLFAQLERAEVCFKHTTEHHRHGAQLEVCEVVMEGHGHVVRACAEADDLAVAVDRVVDKLEHSISKLKDKLVSRSHPRHQARPRGQNSMPVQSPAW